MYTIHLPVVNMREAPSMNARIASQALFGEGIGIEKWAGDWALIRSSDGYLGYVPRASFCERQYRGDVEVSRCIAHLYETADIKYGPIFSLPYGAPLKREAEVDERWLKVELVDGQRAFIQRGDVEKSSLDLIAFSKQFLGLPYVWGGRSSFGFDCSGFVQSVYHHFGVDLPRDAKDQIEAPQWSEISLDQLRVGDLIFWGKSRGEIQHVGMSLGGKFFIHASVRENKPYLRVSQITDFEWSGSPEAFYSFRTAKTKPHQSRLLNSERSSQCHLAD